MDYFHFHDFDDLLNRPCRCGAKAEMLVDFVSDFVVRCSKCHLSTHAYMDPEVAVRHWNDADDIMVKPLHIFFDDPNAALSGQLAAIYIPKDEFFGQPTKQSIDCGTAILRYADKTFLLEPYNGSFVITEDSWPDIGSLDISKLAHTLLDSNPPDHVSLRPDPGQIICFHRAVLSEPEMVGRLEYRWGDSYLFFSVVKDTLIISRDVTAFDVESPCADGDCPLELKFPRS